jgi:hypothetical protein
MSSRIAETAIDPFVHEKIASGRGLPLLATTTLGEGMIGRVSSRAKSYGE